jgi:hypothetical protein
MQRGMSVGGRDHLGRLPAIRQKLREPVGRVGADAVEDVPQVGERLHVEALTGGDQAGEEGRRPGAGVAAEEEPVLPVTVSFR